MEEWEVGDKGISGNLCSNFPVHLVQSKGWDISFISKSLPIPSVAWL